MTADLRYQKSKELGISDDEIVKTFEKKDPTFKARYDRSLELGMTPEEIFTKAHDYYERKKKTGAQKEEGLIEKVGEYRNDVLKQGAQGFGIGALGTYGDILDLFGLQSKEMLPGEKAKNKIDFDILEKMERGEVPSAGELQLLSGDDELAPRFSRLPGTHELESLGAELGVVSEPKSGAGRYARRIGKIGGGGAALGSSAILAPIAAGTAGQTLAELGAPPWMQAAAEIIAGLKASPKSKGPITSNSKEVESAIKDLRKTGYSEKDITLAKNALEDRKILKKFATLTPKAENAIQQGIKNSEQLFKEQIKKGLPGYAEGGLSYLQKQANNVYATMEELASNVPVKNTEPVRKSIQNAIDYLEKYPLLDEQKKFIEFMKDGLNKLQGTKNAGKIAKPGEAGLTAEFLTGFYRNLGKAGNWGDPKQKEHLLGLVKQGIKDSFSQSGTEAAKFGKYFEKTNETWKHWLNTRDLMETLEKAQNVEGMNFKKLSSILNNPENHELAKKVLGPEQLENIKTINKGAEAIESLLKQMKPAGETSKAIRALEGIRAFLTGSWKTFTFLVGTEGAKILARKMLLDPKYQNLTKKIINAAKNNAPQQAAILAQELVEDERQNNSGKKR